MSDYENLLDIAHRIVTSENESYLILQEELLRMTKADLCSCFISEGQLGDLQVSYRGGINSRKAREYLDNLGRKLCFQDRKTTNKVLTLRQFWKVHSQNQQTFAAVLGASEKLANQLAEKDYHLVVKIRSDSERLKPYPESGEGVSRESIIIQRGVALPFEGDISYEQLILPSKYFTGESSLRTDIINMAKFHLLPPYPFSIISIPLGFTYSLNFQEKEFISIGLAWLGTDNAYAIDLDISIVERAIKLSRCVAHEVITNSISQMHLLHILWNIDSLVKNAGLTPREKEALELILRDYDDAQIKEYFAKPCKTTGKSGINSSSATQLLQKLRDKVKSHLQGSEENRKRLQERNISLDFFPTALVKRALMCSEYYHGSR